MDAWDLRSASEPDQHSPGSYAGDAQWALVGLWGKLIPGSSLHRVLTRAGTRVRHLGSVREVSLPGANLAPAQP